MRNRAHLAKSSELPQRMHFELSIDKQRNPIRGGGTYELGGASISVHAPRDATKNRVGMSDTEGKCDQET
jgi:hypothetical protein